MECSQSRTDAPSSEEQPAAQETQAASAAPARWEIGHLLQGGRVAIIEHAGEEYRLRLTANDKLILTK